MSTDGRINENGGRYEGLDRVEARTQIVADLDTRGLLVKTEPYRVPVRRCERCSTVIEPYLSTQWFVRMPPLAAPAIEAVRSGRLRLYPDRWVGVYLHWMENIRDWCISRQLWWGHRIPVWYCSACEHLTVARTDPTACAGCGSAGIHQDPDVLDTWFSSWLWPFSTMGWPDDTPTLRRFYPTDTLITAADIIFFWVARMVMAGYEFMGDCPFTDVCFNSVVRDLQGRKMSKSLGNSPDPLDVIAQYGADALRFTVASLAPPGEDLMYAAEKTDLGRHFANKIWNAARFVMMNVETAGGDGRAVAALDAVDAATLALPERWIVSRLQAVIADTRAALAAYRFNDAALALYQFIWHEYCDWYLELSKIALYGTDAGRQRQVRAVLVHTLDQALRLLHPFMPFVTEEVWQALPVAKPTDSIMIAPYPTADAARRDPAVEDAIGRLIDAVRSVRNIRSELGIPPATPVSIRIAADGRTDEVATFEPYVKVLAKVESVELLHAGERPAGEPSALVEGFGEIFVPLRGVVEASDVRRRLERDLAKVEKELSGVETKLGRSDFIEKAPAEIVEKERQKATTLRDRKGTLQRHLAALGAEG
jgi:valyl-tRNA synthetase